MIGRCCPLDVVNEHGTGAILTVVPDKCGACDQAARGVGFRYRGAQTDSIEVAWKNWTM